MGFWGVSVLSSHLHLSGPISRDTAILSLRYPISRDTFLREVSAPPNGAIPPLITSFHTRTSVRYPFCNISRDNCEIPHKTPSKQEIDLRCLSLLVSRDMKSIPTGPLRSSCISASLFFSFSYLSLSSDSIWQIQGARRQSRCEVFLA